jgi:taurine dioxygenase
MAEAHSAGDWITEQGLRWRRLAPFGVEVDHDLSRPLDSHVAEMFCRLLDREALILARGQALTMQQQQALSAPIGEDVHRAHAQDRGYISTEQDQTGGRGEFSYHSDNAYAEMPMAAISLHAVDVVDRASSTRFVHAGQAYRSLPPALRARLDGLEAEMVKPAAGYIGSRLCDVDDPQVEFSMPFAAVRTNPRTGERYIAVSEMQTARFLGMERDESRALLHEVYRHLYAPEACLEHRWRGGDFILWDNLALQHARGNLAGVGRRILQRVVACLT